MPWDPTQTGATSQQDNQGTPTSTTVPVVASAARTTSGNSATFATGGADSLSIHLDVTAVSGTTPSATFSVEWTNDGTNWFVPSPADTLGAAITAVTERQQTVTVKGASYRLVWVVTGTTPSFTFSIDALQLD